MQKRVPVAAPRAQDEAASMRRSALRWPRPARLRRRMNWPQVGVGATGRCTARPTLWFKSPGIFEGVIEADDLRAAELAQRYGPDHVWSASRLNRYNTCPFGFFVEQILKLEPLLDPEEGLDVLQRGSLLHAILEDLYRRLAQESLCPTPQTEAEVLALLDDCCAQAFRQAPHVYGFRPGPLWQQEQAEMHRLLESLLRAECVENGETPRFRPFVQELGFGIGQDHPAAVLTDADGRSVSVRGLIDRIDRDAEGGLRIIDYKSGSGAHSKPDMLEGRSVQTAVYALAVAQVFSDADVRESVYLHLPTRDTSGRIDATRPDTADLLEAVKTVVNQTAENVRTGRFPSAPGRSARPEPVRPGAIWPTFAG